MRNPFTGRQDAAPSRNATRIADAAHVRIGSAFLGFVLAGLAGLAPAAVFTVTNTNDSGAGSLRDAVAQANAQADPDTINVTATGTILLTSGGIAITGPVTIAGPGSASLTVDGNLNSRIFSIFENTADVCTNPGTDFLVTISGMTLQRARRFANVAGGAIFAEKSLTLDDVYVTNNRARNGGGLAFQTLYPNQSLTIRQSYFTDNFALPLVSGTTAGNAGGGVHISERCATRTQPVLVTIERTGFYANWSEPVLLNGVGAGLAAYSDATIVIRDSDFTGNRVVIPNPPIAGALYAGGGLHVQARSLTLERTLIHGNYANVGGGMRVLNEGATLQGAADRMSVDVINSTVVLNTAFQVGAAIEVYGNVALNLVSTTIEDNLASFASGHGVRLHGGPTVPAGGTGTSSPSASLVSTSLANTVPDTSTYDLFATAVLPDVQVLIDHSLVRRRCTVDCPNIFYTVNKSLFGVDPLLQGLGQNGGSTWTARPLQGSPLIDNGLNPLGLTTDQRGAGFPRVLGRAADIGAHEYPASCSGFIDTDSNSAFCANITWLRNRAVTLGCGSSGYCPTGNVTRDAMAAFMNRLGTALTPQIGMRSVDLGAITLGDGAVYCQTPLLAVEEFPRRATVDAVFMATATTAEPFGVDVMVTTDNGSSWLPVAVNAGRGTLRAGQWANARAQAAVDLNPGDKVRFGIRATRGDVAGTAAIASARCTLRDSIGNRNGTSSPYY